MQAPDLTILSRSRASVLAFGLAALAALVMLFISETSHWRSREALDDTSEINSARLRIQRVLLNVTDAETAQRGYLLTGRKEYLEPYLNATEGLPGLLGWLRRHYGQRDELARSMAQLDQLVDEKMSEITDTLRAYEAGRHDAARELVLTNIGKERMDAIRAAAETMLVEEAKANQVAREKVLDTLIVNRIGVAAMTAFSLFGLFMYLRQTRALDAARRLQVETARAERDQLDAEVKRRTAELTDLSRHLLTAREDERSRLARELHDELGALLTTAKLDAARIKSRVAAASPEAAERLTHLNEMLNSGIALKRRIIEDLHPSSLNNLGLVAALEILARDHQQRSETPVECALQPVVLAPESELTVYRLVQEALTNVAKYAKARHVRVALGTAAGRIEVSVTDDGIGFDPRSRRVSAHGLLGMRYRVEAEGGTLHLTSAPGRGTRIVATLPVAVRT